MSRSQRDCLCGSASGLNLQFKGIGGDYFMKKKSFQVYDIDSLQLICSQIENLEESLWKSAKGADWSISIIDSCLGDRESLHLYYISKPEELYLFRSHLKYFKNDYLAKVLESALNVDEIKDENKYKIEHW